MKLKDLEPLLLRTPKPSEAFRQMEAEGILQSLFPELFALRGVEQGQNHHPEGDVLEHVYLSLDALPIAERSIQVMLAVLVHDLGKAVIGGEPYDEGVHFYGHDYAGVEPATAMLNRITEDKELINNVVALVRHHMRPYDFMKKINKQSLRRLAQEVNIEDLLAVHTADKKGRGGNHTPNLEYVDKIRACYLMITQEVKPLILGRDLINLGLRPSYEFGRILKGIKEAQVDGLFVSHAEGIEFTITYLKGMGLL